MAIGIGQLDRRVTLYSYTEAQDAVGQSIKTYGTGVEVWAKVEEADGSEGQDNQQEIARGRVVFTIRFRTVNEKYKLTYNGDTFDIQSVSEIGRNKYLKLTCTKRDN